MKNVHLLPTDKLIKSAGDLVKDKYGSIHIFTKNDGKEYGKTTTKLNIYITDNSEIKEGNYVVVDCSEIEIEEVRLVIGYYNEQFLFDDRGQIHMDYCKKVILTTDQDLIKDGVQAIDYEFLQWFVKNPSCEQVEVKIEYKDGYGNWSVYDKEFWYKHGNKPKFGIRFKITIPQEELKQEYVKCTCANSLEYSNCGKKCERILDEQEPKQETVEEAAEKYVLNEFDTTLKLISKYSFKDGAKWQAERMYSEKEVIAIVEKSRETGLTAEYLLLTDKFKKK